MGSAFTPLPESHDVGGGRQSWMSGGKKESPQSQSIDRDRLFPVAVAVKCQISRLALGPRLFELPPQLARLPAVLRIELLQPVYVRKRQSR